MPPVTAHVERAERAEGMEMWGVGRSSSAGSYTQLGLWPVSAPQERREGLRVRAGGVCAPHVRRSVRAPASSIAQKGTNIVIFV